MFIEVSFPICGSRQVENRPHWLFLPQPQEKLFLGAGSRMLPGFVPILVAAVTMDGFVLARQGCLWLRDPQEVGWKPGAF